jgi:hypothetical protein
MSIQNTRFRLPAFLCAALVTALYICSPVFADTPRQRVDSNLRDISRSAQQMLNSTAQFLQSRGRFVPAPQGFDLQLCQELQGLQQQLTKLTFDNKARLPYQVLAPEVQQIQVKLPRVDQLVNTIGASRDVKRKWDDLRNDIDAMSRTFYGASPFAWNRYYDSDAQVISSPGYNPPGGFSTNGVNKLNSDTDQFVGQVVGFVQSRGRWGGRPTDGQLIQELRGFQSQVDQFVLDSNNPGRYNYVNQELQQLQVRSSNIDQLLQMSAVPPNFTNNWWQVKAGINGMVNIYGTPGFNPPRESFVDYQGRFNTGASGQTGWKKFWQDSLHSF